MHQCKPNVSGEGSFLTVWFPIPILLFTWEAYPAAVTSLHEWSEEHPKGQDFWKAGLSSNTLGTFFIKLYKISQRLRSLNVIVYLNQY